ncbi:UNVERIFIED_CONTAM: hypothetical protein Sindi_2641800 [Sesamum indicum]
MYDKKLLRRAGLTLELKDGVKTFKNWAKCQRGHMDGDKTRCPCRKCKNTKFRTPNDVSNHLCMRGFMPECDNWTSHSEEMVQEYFDIVVAPLVLKKQTPVAHEEVIIHTGVMEQQTDWAQKWFLMQPGRVIVFFS